MNPTPPPDPNEIAWLQHEADQEEESVDLHYYGSVIDTLREKGMSWRKIAEWLKKRNVPVTHNQLYYFHKEREEMKELNSEIDLDFLDS